ncbi:DUF3995 domain-containing protein [Phyllobacterium sp. 22229]|uniref:DUF3995 domain-containing protein n=1 Tax=Phyllobacterium sp. 22229 TaxID=3453895 RepID=UPI003F8574CA
MTHVLAWLVFIVLTIVAALHLYWGFGGLWPARDPLSLARAVVGSKGIARMPSRGVTVVVAVLIFTAGVLAPMQLSIIPALLPAGLLRFGILVLTVIFLARGSLSFTAFFRNRQAEEPFLTLDRRYYGPLCLAIGAGFAVLLFA